MVASAASTPFSTTPIVAAGGSHSLALRADGTVWAWGSNLWGQLGIGTTDNKNTPVQVRSDGAGGEAFLQDIVSIAAGENHSFALRADGTVWAWGSNISGQLGDGTAHERLTPVKVVRLENITTISAGVSHSIAIKEDGTVWTWGANNRGQLGDGTTISRSAPMQVLGGATGNTFLQDIISVAAGEDHSLALRADGTVWAWGMGLGQLGIGAPTFQTTTAVQVRGGSAGGMFLQNIIAISAGNNHSIALRDDGTVWAWGFGSGGRLGNASTSNQDIPVQVHGGAMNEQFLQNIISISTGASHSLALCADGAVWSWGSGSNGQLGNGVIGNSDIPVQVHGGATGKVHLQDIAFISAGLSGMMMPNGAHSLALRADGTIWAWGHGSNGELGNGTTTNRNFPVQVAGWEIIPCGMCKNSGALCSACNHGPCPLDPYAMTCNCVNILVVTNGNDSGSGSLRAVVAEAPAGSIITFAPGVTEVILTSNEIAITRANITIDGGQGVIIRRSDAPSTPEFRILNDNSTGWSSVLTLKNLTLQNGVTTGGGGGVLARAYTVIINCHFIGNIAQGGGGLASGRVTAIINSTFAGNTANRGAAVISLQRNPMPGTHPNVLYMINSTISENITHEESGGAIDVGDVGFLLHLTATNNQGGGVRGRGLADRFGNGTVIGNSIISGNTNAAGTAPLQISGNASSVFEMIFPNMPPVHPSLYVLAQFENLIEGYNDVMHEHIFASNAFNKNIGTHIALSGGIANNIAIDPTSIMAYFRWLRQIHSFDAPSPTTISLGENLFLPALAHDQLSAPRATTGAVTFGAVESTFTPPDCPLCQDSGNYCPACNPEPPPPSSMPAWLRALISFASGALGVFALVLGWVWVR